MARRLSKFIGGQGVFTWASHRNSILRFDLNEETIRTPVRNSGLSVNRLDYSGIRISPDGLYALAGSNSSPFLRVIDGDAEDWLTIATPPTSVVNDIAFKPDGTEFTVGMGSSPFLYRYNYPGFALQTAFTTAPSGAVSGVSYNGAGTKLAVSIKAAPYIEVFDMATLAKETYTLSSPPTTTAVEDVAFSPDGTMIAVVGSATGVRRVRVYAYPSGTLLFSDTGTSNTYKCEFSPDSSKLAVLQTGTSGILLLNTSTWATIRTLATASASGFYNLNSRAMQWIDNDFIFFSSEGGSCQIVDTRSGTGVTVAGVEHGGGTSVGGGYISPLTVPRKVAGTVDDGAGGPLARTVRAFDTATGHFLGETVSNAGTGAFTLDIWSAEPVTVIAMGGVGENAKVFDPVTPVVR